MHDQQVNGDKRGNCYAFPMDPLTDNVVNNLGLEANGQFEDLSAQVVIREEDDERFAYIPWINFRRACNQAWQRDKHGTFASVWDDPEHADFKASYTDRQGKVKNKSAITGKLFASHQSFFPPDHFKFSDWFTKEDYHVMMEREAPACKTWLGPVRCNILGLDS